MFIQDVSIKTMQENSITMYQFSGIVTRIKKRKGYFMKTTTISYTGTSMYPLLKDGDTLTAQNIPFKELNRKDIIYFKIPRSEGKAVHRIIDIDYNKKHVKTKGDGSLKPDPHHLHPENILGKIVSFKRNGSETHLTHKMLKKSYLFSKFIHPLRKIRSIIKTQTIFRS